MAVTRGLSELADSPLASKRRKTSSTHMMRLIDVEAPAAQATDAFEVIDLDFSPRASPQTPPESRSGSPRLKFQVDHIPKSRTYKSIYASYPLPSIQVPETATPPPVRLPSMQELEQSIERFVQSHGHSTAPPPTSLSPASFSSPGPHHGLLNPAPPPTKSSSFQDAHGYGGHVGHALRSPVPLFSDPYSGYPSPPPEGDSRHINKKYTTEEGDFIIYALHDKKQKWLSITKDFAQLFGRTPERSMQGLQAWYYRMNQKVPVWDDQGYLVFDNDDDEEPRTVAIKCRDKDRGDLPLLEPLGLSQRYPERLMAYSWADAESKHQARDWADKRMWQYRQRRERKRKRDARKPKL